MSHRDFPLLYWESYHTSSFVVCPIVPLPWFFSLVARKLCKTFFFSLFFQFFFFAFTLDFFACCTASFARLSFLVFFFRSSFFHMNSVKYVLNSRYLSQHYWWISHFLFILSKFFHKEVFHKTFLFSLCKL